MLRRVLEGAVVAAVASVVTLFITDRPDLEDASAVFTTDLLRGLIVIGGPMLGWLWTLAVVLFMAGVLIQVVPMAPASKKTSRDWSVTFPSLPTTLMGVGLGAGLTAAAIGLAALRSPWALPVLGVLLFWTLRWARDLRYRWTRVAGIP
jgi:hypothetical protein